MSIAQYETTRLPNGVTIATAAMPHMESVAAGIWAKVGARHEPKSLHGIAHFTEHLLFKGSACRNALQIIQDIENLGASANAYTTEDHTCYYAKGPANRFARLCEVLLDMYRFATFPEDEIEREREIIEEEIVMYREQPSQHIDDLLSAVAWQGHPLGRPITGTAKSLRKIGRDDFIHFAHTYYRGRNTILTLAGNIAHDAVLERLLPLIDELEEGKAPRRRLFQPPDSNGSPRIQVEKRPVEQAHLSLAFYACHRLDPDRFALKLLNVILGENMSSRLWQLLREQSGYCYQIQSEVHSLEDTGLWHLYFALDPAKLHPALEVIARELNRIAREPVSSLELERAREYTIAQHRLSLESTTQQMMWAGESLLATHTVVDPSEICEHLRKVTPGDVQRIAAQILTRRNLNVAAISPRHTPGEILDALPLP